MTDSELIPIWAGSGAVTEPDSVKFETGWLLGEQPNHQFMNYLERGFAEKTNHILKHGVPRWNNETMYYAGDIVTHVGEVWSATTGATNSEPSEVNTNWAKIPSKTFVESLLNFAGYTIVTPAAGDLVLVQRGGNRSVINVSNLYKKLTLSAYSIGANTTGANAQVTSLYVPPSRLVGRPAGGNLGVVSLVPDLGFDGTKIISRFNGITPTISPTTGNPIFSKSNNARRYVLHGWYTVQTTNTARLVFNVDGDINRPLYSYSLIQSGAFINPSYAQTTAVISGSQVVGAKAWVMCIIIFDYTLKTINWETTYTDDSGTGSTRLSVGAYDWSAYSAVMNIQLNNCWASGDWNLTLNDIS